MLHQAKDHLSPDLLWVILGPTASGKTKLAVALAEQIGGEIISADSRQVYRGMDIGTGKDLKQYETIPYHLIDIRKAGDRYDANAFKADFFDAYDDIICRGKIPILCGGSGSYIQQLLQDNPYSQIPRDKSLQEELAKLTKEELIAEINNIGIPNDLKIDFDNHKRLVRALEIIRYVQQHDIILQPQRTVRNYIVFGLHPPIDQRRQRITKRLHERLDAGMIDEVRQLLANGLTHEDLQYYGLEYKYISLYLQEKLNYNTFVEKLNTEIHRYAKRQMTYFRKMEREGIKTHWM